MNRAPYLVDVPLETARARWDEALDEHGVVPRESELVALEDALDRVSAEPVVARLSSPHEHKCAMDGIALDAARTRGVSETSPVELLLGIDAHVVDTGDPLPPGTDAVIPVELLESRPDGRVAVRAPVAAWDHVRPLGEDVVATEIVVPAARRLGPAELAAIAGAGVGHVRVVRRPRVAIVTTGDELVDVDAAPPPPGAIVDSNRILLAAAVRRAGGVVEQHVRVADDPERIAATIDAALRTCDVVVVNAGSSAGRDDYTARVFERFAALLVHGVAIRPGHPLVLAVAPAPGDGRRRAVPLLGIPGYPVSAALCADLFLRPLLERLGRRDAPEVREIEVELARKLYSPLGEDEFVRAVVARVDDRLVATPLRRGAGAITSLARANALIVVPRFREGFPAGARVTARALRPPASFERTLLAVGSHDVALDAVAGRLAARGVEFVSANVGSVAGLVALRARAAHLAGTHLLDPETGTYNDAALRRYGPDEPVALVALARREQGLIVAAGNPLDLRDLADVVRRRARYVNRQRDAGTRVLLDVLLARARLRADDVDGYDRVEPTHTAVAALVADGAADAGLGIRAAAAALGCAFVPVAWEPYELAVPVRLLEEPRVAALLAVLREPQTIAAIESLGGYDAAECGAVRFPAAATAAS